jgi:polysaccharide export outer membrane protein
MIRPAVARQLSRLLLFILGFMSAHILRAQELAPQNPEYQLERSDVLEVKYRYTPEFDQIVAIGPDGRATLTGLGSFIATGLTVDQFQAKVITVSSERLVKPVVTVALKEFDKPHVFVEGDVNTPGRVEFRSDISITDAIALAGGFKTSGKKSEVLLLRRGSGDQPATRVVNIKKLLASHHLEEAVELRSGDVIYVPQDNLSKIERLVHLGQFGAIYNPIP